MTREDALELVKAIRTNNHYEPNSWEEDFLESIEIQIIDEEPLSARQGAKLEDIYRKAYGDK